MKYQSFSYTPDELAEQLSSALQDTLLYLARTGYLNKDAYEELTNRLMISAIPKRKGFGRKILERFFGPDGDESAWVFPIVEIPEMYGKKNPKPTATDGKYKGIDNVVKIKD